MKYITYTPGTESHFVDYRSPLVTELETGLQEVATSTTTAKPLAATQDLVLVLASEQAVIFTVELSADGSSWFPSRQFSQPGGVSLTLRCRPEGGERSYRINTKALRAQNKITAYSQLRDAALLPDPKPLQWS